MVATPGHDRIVRAEEDLARLVVAVPKHPKHLVAWARGQATVRGQLESYKEALLGLFDEVDQNYQVDRADWLDQVDQAGWHEKAEHVELVAWVDLALLLALTYVVRTAVQAAAFYSDLVALKNV